MKKIFLSLVFLLSLAVGASAMSYSQARDQALFLTDKMAYELNLTEEQYEAAYEINLDYLMSIDSSDDLYGAYWEQRNLDLSYILFSWQYDAFLAASYFYRPLYWEGGYWHFAVYGRYPHRDYFFFGRPVFYTTYRGGHSWHHNGGRSYWASHRVTAPHGDHRPNGMRDQFDKGHFGNGTRITAHSGSRTFGNGNRNTGSRPVTNGSHNNVTLNGNRSFGNRQSGNTRTQDTARRSFGTTRPSSTRTTVTRPSSTGARNFDRSSTTTPSRTFKPSTQKSTTRTLPTPNRSFSSPSSSRSVGNTLKSRGSSGSSFKSRSFGGGKSSGSSSSRGHFGGRR